jgi:hypothetical protein
LHVGNGARVNCSVVIHDAYIVVQDVLMRYLKIHPKMLTDMDHLQKKLTCLFAQLLNQLCSFIGLESLLLHAYETATGSYTEALQ